MRRCMSLLLFGGLIVSIAGCGGGGTNNPPPNNPPPTGTAIVAFVSQGAVDGSDNSNTSCPPFTMVQNIWSVRTDGSGIMPLTKNTSCINSSENPIWSPDGRKLAFYSARPLDGSDTVTPGKVFNIWVTQADGTGATPLTRLTATSAFVLAWSPDGSRLAFVSDRALDGSDAGGAGFNIWVMNADGTGAAPVTRLMGCGMSVSVIIPVEPIVSQAGWSPDGSKLVFQSSCALDGSDASNGDGFTNVWIVNADGTGRKPLTKYTPTVVAGDASWSPDSSKVVFTSIGALDGSNANALIQNIWVVKADGTGATPLTRYTAAGTAAGSARWSPDGTRILYESTGALDGSDAADGILGQRVDNIWVIKADGTGATPLTKVTDGGPSSEEAAWSPDGAKIVFMSNRALDGSNARGTFFFNIWVMNNDGSGAAPLTRFQVVDLGGPVWQP